MKFTGLILASVAFLGIHAGTIPVDAGKKAGVIFKRDQGVCIMLANIKHNKLTLDCCIALCGIDGTCVVNGRA